MAIADPAFAQEVEIAAAALRQAESDSKAAYDAVQHEQTAAVESYMAARAEAAAAGVAQAARWEATQRELGAAQMQAQKASAEHDEQTVVLWDPPEGADKLIGVVLRELGGRTVLTRCTPGSQVGKACPALVAAGPAQWILTYVQATSVHHLGHQAAAATIKRWCAGLGGAVLTLVFRAVIAPLRYWPTQLQPLGLQLALSDRGGLPNSVVSGFDPGSQCDDPSGVLFTYLGLTLQSVDGVHAAELQPQDAAALIAAAASSATAAAAVQPVELRLGWPRRCPVYGGVYFRPRAGPRARRVKRIVERRPVQRQTDPAAAAEHRSAG
eukprot:SAG22_NODE_5054_length_1099_cov_1.441000_1_plen_324_part_01